MKTLKLATMVAALSIASIAHAESMTQAQLNGLFQDTSLSPDSSTQILRKLNFIESPRSDHKIQ